MLIPIQDNVVVINANGELCGTRGPLDLDPIQHHLFHKMLLGGYALEDLTSDFPKAEASGTDRILTALTRFIQKCGYFKLVQWHPPREIDIIIVDRGWQGVFQHSVDLWQLLSKQYRVLLIAPVEPPYGFDVELSEYLVTPERLGGDDGSMTHFISIARTLLKKLRPKLCFVSHRALMGYFYDTAESIPTIVHGDHHFDDHMAIGKHMASARESLDPVSAIQEMLYTQMTGTSHSLTDSHASYLMTKHAAEVWFYTDEQRELAWRAHGEMSPKFKVVLPLINSVAFSPTDADGKEPILLFCTTNRGKAMRRKGLDPLRAVLSRLPASSRIRMVINDKDDVPEDMLQSPQVEVIERLPKSEMAKIYRAARAYCRVSGDDSSPVSVLEAMAAGVPVIVSPNIAFHIPSIRDCVNGFVVEPDDEELLLLRLQTILTDYALRISMGKKARQAALPYSFEANSWMFEPYVSNISTPEAADHVSV